MNFYLKFHVVIYPIYTYTSKNPAMFARQIRNKLLYDNVCCEKKVPSITALYNIMHNLKKRTLLIKDCQTLIPRI